MPGSYCDICGRPLKNEASIRLGIGPECYGKIKSAKWEESDPLTIKRGPRNDWPEKMISLGPSCSRKERNYHFMFNLGREHIVFSMDNGSEVQRYVRHISYHSPSGMSFGYAGSGPSDCARSVLADCIGLPLADLLYQDFKSDFISKIDQYSGGTIQSADIYQWAEAKIELALSRNNPIEHE